MDRRQLLLGMAACGISAKIGRPTFLSTQSGDSLDSPQANANAALSDREEAGLHGPVRTCTEESGSSSDKYVRISEYDFDGRLLSLHSSSTGWQSSETRTYDSAGRLLRTESKSGESSSLQIYAYDDNGRLLSVTDGDGHQTTYRYDGQRLQSETVVIPPRAKDSSVGIGATALIEAAEEGSMLQEGGTVTRFYDEFKRLAESRILDSEGNLVARVVRSYDSRGHITSEKLVPENLELGLAKRMLKELPEEYQNEETLREVKEQLGHAMATLWGNSEKTYEYDSQGRLTATHIRTGFYSEDILRTFNDQGDVIESIEKFGRGQSPFPTGVPFHQDETGKLVTDKPQSEWPAAPPIPPRAKVAYTYRYDNFGNWTERTENGPHRSTVTTRTITYY